MTGYFCRSVYIKCHVRQDLTVSEKSILERMLSRTPFLSVMLVRERNMVAVFLVDNGRPLNLLECIIKYWAFKNIASFCCSILLSDPNNRSRV